MENHFMVAALTLLALLLVSALLRPVSLRTKIPFSVLLVLAGMGLGLLSPRFDLPWNVLTDKQVFTELIMLILLPTLVFESALNLDVKQLQANYRAILFLALPGLLISAGIITVVIMLLTQVPWKHALLLGVILSATDPVAVVEVFKRIGAPKDLTLLIEAESLFNDATTIVLTKLILFALATQLTLDQMLWSGLQTFVLTCVGALVYGWLLGHIAYRLLVRLRQDPYIEITITLLLAYGSFLSAEYLFHTSGIISTVVAALVLVRDRPLPLPRRTERQLSNFWGFLDYLASSMIFLMVGLMANFDVIVEGMELAVVVIIGMLISRALVVYGLMPQAGQLRFHSRRVQMAYRHLLNWGGLRGAITLALAMGISVLPGAQLVLPVALVAVLFTIIVQGASIGWFAHYLKLDIPDTTERISRAEAWLAAKQNARDQLVGLGQTHFASTGAPQAYTQRLDQQMAALKKQLIHWRSQEEGPAKEWERYLIRGLSLEISYSYQFFDQGLLEPALYSRLRRHLDQQLDALRYGANRDQLALFEKIPTLWSRLFGHQRQARSAEQLAADDYLIAWTRRIICRFTIEQLEQLMAFDSAEAAVREDVRRIYRSWYQAAKDKITSIEASFPEVAAAQQQQLVQRMSSTAQIDHLNYQAKIGLLKEGEAQSMIEELEAPQESNSDTDER